MVWELGVEFPACQAAESQHLLFNYQSLGSARMQLLRHERWACELPLAPRRVRVIIMGFRV